MQFSFNCEEILECDQNGYAILEGSYQSNIAPGYKLFVNEIINTMGELSSNSQKLPFTITTAYKFFMSHHRLIIKAKNNTVLGFIKIGNKNLYLHDKNFNYHEVKNVLCLLDFYVYEPLQHRGIGKEIFDYMLSFEKVNAELIVYENPSPQLINFLRKYYNLQSYIKQNNNEIIFGNFFINLPNKYCINIDYDKYTFNALNNNFSTHPKNNYNEKYKQRNFLAKSAPSLEIFNSNKYSNNKLIFNNCFTNNVINKDVYKNPILGFQKYYLNNENTLAYDNIYSKKKINLINDYLKTKIQNDDDYFKENFQIKENNINNSNNRLNELSYKLIDNQKNYKYQNDQLYNKRDSFATVFDDKKLVKNDFQRKNFIDKSNLITEKDFLNYNYSYQKNDHKRSETFQHYTPFCEYGKVYTNVLPTSSKVYGNYYQQKTLNNRYGDNNLQERNYLYNTYDKNLNEQRPQILYY